MRDALTRVLLASLMLLGSNSTASASEVLKGRASVIDGDTIEIHGQRIRLHGIDAPESAQRCERNGDQWRCGREAAWALDDELRHRAVTCTATDRDRYGRIVAVCGTRDIADINGWLVEQGLALAYRQYSREYVPQEKDAERRNRGIWAGDFIEPWNWRYGVRLTTDPKCRQASCSAMASCREARYALNRCGYSSLDGDRDGVPCESLCAP
ncbi:thermonuclease family protein [Spectribacter hydrogenoxidans]|uniref:Thermonuclease family protein n=1 Tax=Spectribacter hydrogenoxidans TaxID=3075608 RepID=A0ABU3C477_9GAMM|nr:thermonuclease family protein [Salinisphaera sp. W335]MDT0636350.1 thermonuclease family protein [Salinisphaera sp. W335]